MANGSMLYAIQCGLNAQSAAKYPSRSMGRDEKAAVRQAKKAEMAFRISMGYEKDNVWTRIKYWFKRE